MMKVCLQNLSEVAQTLLIPLYFRVLESQRPDGIIRDQKAIELIKRLEFDYDKLKGRSFDQIAAILRAREIDNRTRVFLSEHPDAVVVHIGCGLDTRFDRLDNGQVDWFDLDLPEVISLRRQLLPETPRSHYLGYSVLDQAWMDCVGERAGRPLLLLAEGVLPFFREGDVRRMVGALSDRFSGAELVFDAISPFLVRVHNLRAALTGIGATVYWGLKQSRDLEAWGPGLKLLSEWRCFDQPEPRLGWSRLLRYVPPAVGGLRVLQYRL